jgi:hypothetical protein
VNDDHYFSADPSVPFAREPFSGCFRAVSKQYAADAGVHQVTRRELGHLARPNQKRRAACQ